MRIRLNFAQPDENASSRGMERPRAANSSSRLAQNLPLADVSPTDLTSSM
jgi:hypothetical protein